MDPIKNKNTNQEIEDIKNLKPTIKASESSEFKNDTQQSMGGLLKSMGKCYLLTSNRFN
jgi:hypothetical protein